MALFLDVGPGDVLRIGNDIAVTVEKKSGARARLRIIGPKSVDVELIRKAELPKDNDGFNYPAVETGD